MTPAPDKGIPNAVQGCRRYKILHVQAGRTLFLRHRLPTGKNPLTPAPEYMPGECKTGCNPMIATCFNAFLGRGDKIFLWGNSPVALLKLPAFAVRYLSLLSRFCPDF